MTKFSNPSFTVPIGGTKAYDEGYERTFGRKIKYVKGDATLPEEGGIRVVTHIVNDIGRFGSGFAKAVLDKYPIVKEEYLKLYTDEGLTLGVAQFVKINDTLWFANIVGQHGVIGKKNPTPIRYDAIKKGLAKVRDFVQVKKATVHMPRMGSGLAGGDWKEVEKIVKDELSMHLIQVTVYDLES